MYIYMYVCILLGSLFLDLCRPYCSSKSCVKHVLFYKEPSPRPSSVKLLVFEPIYHHTVVPKVPTSHLLLTAHLARFSSFKY